VATDGTIVVGGSNMEPIVDGGGDASDGIVDDDVCAAGAADVAAGFVAGAKDDRGANGLFCNCGGSHVVEAAVTVAAEEAAPDVDDGNADEPLICFDSRSAEANLLAESF